MKRIYIHPSRIASLRRGDCFDVDSGMGGSFTVRLDRIEDGIAHFTIVSSCPPPDGWKGTKRQRPINELATTLFLSVPEGPWLDGGKQEHAALIALGYPEDSQEFQTLYRRMPSLKPQA